MVSQNLFHQGYGPALSLLLLLHLILYVKLLIGYAYMTLIFLFSSGLKIEKLIVRIKYFSITYLELATSLTLLISLLLGKIKGLKDYFLIIQIPTSLFYLADVY